ncbi:MAG: tyrosine-type recombinase/integrase [Hyphomicrobiaceae bacterium]
MRHVTFDFAHQDVPSLAEIIAMVATHPAVPKHRRAGIASSLSKLAAWIGQDASTIPFVALVIEAKIATVRPDVVGVSAKRLKNARSDIRFVLDLLGGSSRYHAPFTPEAQRLWDLLQGKYERCSLSRLLRYLSARAIDPAEVDEGVSAGFLDALRREGRLRIKPETFHQSAMRAWNRAVRRYPAWPQVTLTVPTYRTRASLPWSAFPPSLEHAVDRFLASGEAVESLFDGPSHRPLKPRTKTTQKNHIRRAASALVAARVPRLELSGLSSLSKPSRFRLALERIIEDRKGKIGGYVMGLAWTLVKMARYGGELTSDEVTEVNDLYRRLSTRRRGETPSVDRDQEALSLLDDPRRLDALLTLPSRTAERVLKAKLKFRAAALEIQRACALEIWFCAPLRISNLATLRLDQHFHRVTIDGREHWMIRIPAEEVKNGEALEFLLTKAAVNLLKIYVSEYRPALVTGPTPWVFPGRQDGHKQIDALRKQMERFVNDATGIGFHPHLIRKITAKIYLDADPGGIEIVRRCLGHRDVRTTLSVYTQPQIRAAQLKYLNALESRKLSALRQGFEP